MPPTPTLKGCLCSRNADRGPRSTRSPALAKQREKEEEIPKGRRRKREGAPSKAAQKWTRLDSRHRLTQRGTLVIWSCWRKGAPPAPQPCPPLQQHPQPITAQGSTPQPISGRDPRPLLIKARGPIGWRRQPIRALAWRAAAPSSQSTTRRLLLLRLSPMGGR